MGNERGFTLIELVVVIAIFVGLMAIAIPNFENMVFGSTVDRAVMELTTALQNARMKAIKTHRVATVTFNAPAVNQITVNWTENGNRIRIYNLSPNPRRITFDNNPPGGAQPPDNIITFNNQGFAQPVGGKTTCDVYLIDNDTGRRYHIAMTVAGSIVERLWNGNAWLGPIL